MPMNCDIKAYPNVILFDWDGTLVSTLKLLFNAHNYVREHLEYPLWSVKEARKNIRLSAKDAFPQLYGDNAHKALELYYDYVRANHLNKLEPCSGAKNLLEELAHKEKPLGIISNKKHDILEKEIKYLDWNKYFTTWVGAGNAKRDKPDPAPVNKALADLNYYSSSEQVWYVGDTKEDMKTAYLAGITPIFVEHGFGDKHELSNEYNIQSYENLEALSRHLSKF